MLKLLESDKQSKLDQESIHKAVTAEYKVKKKKYGTLPKYLLQTRLNLDVDTYRNWYCFKDIISE